MITQMIQRLRKDHTEPHELTKAILSEIGDDPDKMFTALEEVLPTYCRRSFGNSRRTAARTPLPVITTSTSAGPISKKQQRIRNWWQTQLAENFNVPGKGYLALGKMTKTDLIASAQVRRDQAAGNIEWANRLEKLATALQTQHVSRVEQLSEASFTTIWDRRP